MAAVPDLRVLRCAGVSEVLSIDFYSFPRFAVPHHFVDGLIPVLGSCVHPRAEHSPKRAREDACAFQCEWKMWVSGDANPAAAARSLGNYRGTGEIVPFCTCGALMAK